MRVVFLSTPVGALGSGIGGGVELTLRTLADGLVRNGHRVTVVAPSDSVLDGHHLEAIDGALHVPSQTLDRRDSPSVPRNSVLVQMWRRVVELAKHGEYDVVLNFAYDELPFRHSGECPVPVMHLVSMGSLSEVMDAAVRDAATAHPGCIAMHSRAQAATFGPEMAKLATIVASGVDVETYDFVAEPDADIAFVGRISREKGIDDAFAVSALSGRRLLVFGLMEDEDAWREARLAHPKADVVHVGFLSTIELQRRLGRCAALVMVHRWVEAFGNVAVEALACGVPVITYNRGGPVEIVRDGVTGFVVPVDDPAGVVEALGRLPAIDRRRCRADAVERFSATAFVERVEAWLRRSVAESPRAV